MSNNFFEIQLTDKAKLRIKKSAIVATIVNENDDNEVDIYVKNIDCPFHVKNSQQLRDHLNEFWYDVE